MSDKKRCRGIAVHRSLLIGTTSTPLSRAELLSCPPEHTHKWTVAVRSAASNPLPPLNAKELSLISPDGDKANAASADSSVALQRGISTRGRETETDYHRLVGGKDDISHFIKRVQFKLHETYPSPTRNLDKPPYQVTETGWGEFEIQIKIFFVNEANEKPLTYFHHLKLHPWQPIPGSSLAYPNPLLGIQNQNQNQESKAKANQNKSGTTDTNVEIQGQNEIGKDARGERVPGSENINTDKNKDSTVESPDIVMDMDPEQSKTREKAAQGESSSSEITTMNSYEKVGDGDVEMTDATRANQANKENDEVEQDSGSNQTSNLNSDSNSNPTADQQRQQQSSSSTDNAQLRSTSTSTGDQTTPATTTALAPPKLPTPPVVHSWQYEEIVFPEPTEAFFDILNSNVPTPLPETSAQAFTDPTTYHQFLKLRDELAAKNYLASQPSSTTGSNSGSLSTNSSSITRSTRTSSSNKRQNHQQQPSQLLTPPHPIHSPTGYLTESISMETIANEGNRLERARIESVRNLERGRERLIAMERKLKQLRNKSRILVGGDNDGLGTE